MTLIKHTETIKFQLIYLLSIFYSLLFILVIKSGFGDDDLGPEIPDPQNNADPGPDAGRDIAELQNITIWGTDVSTSVCASTFK